MSLTDERALQRLEHTWLEPPTDNAPLCSCCGLPADEVYFISYTYCEDCAKALHSMWVLDEPVECCCCDNEITEQYYEVSGDAYCESCFERYFKD